MTSQERLILAPAGRLGLTFAIAEDGGARVSIITHGSPLLGKLGVGEILVSVDGQDTSKLTPPELASLLKRLHIDVPASAYDDHVVDERRRKAWRLVGAALLTALVAVVREMM